MDAVAERAPDNAGEGAIRGFVEDWLAQKRSLLFAIRSKVLPEAFVVLLNPLHPQAASVPPLTTRPFDFAQALHKPPMLDEYTGG